MAVALAVPRLRPAQPRTNAYCHEEREPIFHDYYKSRSLRSLFCTLGVSKNTVSAWTKESERAPEFSETLLAVDRWMDSRRLLEVM